MKKITLRFKKYHFFLFLISFAVSINSCSKVKNEDTVIAPPTNLGSEPPKNVVDLSNPIFKQNRLNPDFSQNLNPLPTTNSTNIAGLGLINEDYSDEIPTILGQQLTNPYTRENMANAYNLVYGTNYVAGNLPITHYYIKYTPANMEQWADIEEKTELELYTHPLDYEIIQDGDYHAAPGKTPNDIPELYTVIEADTTIPNFAPHTILAALHIPPNNDLVVEEFAESAAAGAVYVRTTDGKSVTISRTDERNIEPLRIPLPCDIIYINSNGPEPGIENPWENNPCVQFGPGGGGGGYTPSPTCGTSNLTCAESNRPRGRLRYWDTQLNGGTCVALENVKVIGKNWFKGIAPRNHMYTDASGVFNHNLKFKRVNVNVHFRNAGISVRPLRTAKWLKLSLFTLKDKLGSFNNGCGMNTIEETYIRPQDKESKTMEYWVASQVINGFAEFKQQAAVDEIKTFSGWRLKYYIQRDDIARTRGPEARVPMHNYIHSTQSTMDIVNSIAKTAGYILKAQKNPISYLPAALEVMRQLLGSQRADVVLLYNTYPGESIYSFENLSSSEIFKEIYSTFTKVSVIKNSNNKEVKNYLKREDKLVQSAISLIGAGISIGEGSLYKFLKKFWQPSPQSIAQYQGVTTWVTTVMLYNNSVEEEFFDINNGFSDYYGHKLADRKYGISSDKFFNERKFEVQSTTTTSAHKIFLESYNAQALADENQTYKVGLFFDLEDNVVDEVKNETNIFRNKNDNVTNIKPKDIFKSITEQYGGTPLANSWQQFKNNLQTKFPLQTFNINELCYAYAID